MINSDHLSLADYVTLESPDIFKKTRAFSTDMVDYRNKGYETYMRPVLSPSDRRIKVQTESGERDVILMCSSNYLGMASHPKVVAAAHAAIDKFGVSVMAVPLIAGTSVVHRELETALSNLKSVEAAAMFPTGYSANQGVISALVRKDDWVIVDNQVHCSIAEGIRLAKAHMVAFRHSCMPQLEEVLERTRKNAPNAGILVIVEGVYGIDGDVVPLPDVMRIARSYEARVMIDESHATGVLGATGRGTTEHFNMSEPPDIVMDSLSKAFGGMGGWIGAPAHAIDYLRYYSRPISFSVGLPVPSAAAGLAAMQVMLTDQTHVARLKENIEMMRSGLTEMGLKNPAKSESAIMSIVVGDELKLRRINRDLVEADIWMEALPFPAVPRGEERIRLRLMATHTAEDLQKTLGTLHQVFVKHGVITPKATIIAHPGIDTEPTIKAKQIRTATEPDDYEAVARFLWNIETSEPNGVAWYSTKEKAKHLRGESLYQRNNVESATFFVEEAGRILCTATAFLDRRANPMNTGMPGGFIGGLGVRPGSEEIGLKVLKAAEDFLYQRHANLVLAPADVPLPIFGGGLIVENQTGLTPFFQPCYALRYRKMLQQAGYASMLRRSYYSFDLTKDVEVNKTSESLGSVVVRLMNKLDWVNEASEMCHIINECFPALGHHWGFTQSEFEDFARQMMDMVFEGLWLIAEVDGIAAGFIAGFPTTPDAFRRTGGDVGPINIEEINDDLQSAKTGSIVWLAVRPKYAGMEVGKHLLSSILGHMKNRGYTLATATWEIYDPDTSAADLVAQSGGTAPGYEIEIMGKQLVNQ